MLAIGPDSLHVKTLYFPLRALLVLGEMEDTMVTHQLRCIALDDVASRILAFPTPKLLGLVGFHYLFVANNTNNFMGARVNGTTKTIS
jgi:hypothetical protein